MFPGLMSLQGEETEVTYHTIIQVLEDYNPKAGVYKLSKERASLLSFRV